MLFRSLLPAPRLLLVDDEPESISPVQIWLQRQGAETLLATCAETADSVLRRGQMDAVVCDVHMPGNNRLQWVQRLTTEESHPPLFLLTGRPEMETALAAANLPVAGYFIKPPDYAELGTRLLICIRRWRLRRDLLVRLATLTQQGGLAGLGPGLGDQLQDLSRFLQENRICSPQQDSSVDWPTVIRETIAVLAKTKDSFHSKELASLRLKLSALLVTAGPAPSAGPTPGN